MPTRLTVSARKGIKGSGPNHHISCQGSCNGVKCSGRKKMVIWKAAFSSSELSFCTHYLDPKRSTWVRVTRSAGIIRLFFGCSFQFGECHSMPALPPRLRRGGLFECPSKKHVSRESRQYGSFGRHLHRPRSEGEGIDGLAVDQYQRPICKWQHSSYTCCAR